MKRPFLFALLTAACAFAVGALATAFWTHRPGRVPDPPAVVARLREVARLETLEIAVYKKVSFEPEPSVSESLPGALWDWAKFTLRPPKGRAIVFATIRLGVDLERLDASRLALGGDQATVQLPPLKAVVELKPGETEVIGSTLDSAQTAQLLQIAKESFEREVLADPALRARASASAERAIRSLLLELGYSQVRVQPSI